MKYLILIIFFLFTGCVVQTQEDYSLTNVENDFYKKKFGENMSLDSLDRQIFKYVPWSQFPGQYSYQLMIYLSDRDNRVDSTAFQMKVDSTAQFVINFMKKEKKELHEFSLLGSLNGNSIWFLYNVDDKNQPHLRDFSYCMED